jgi:hypothetical protein
MKTAVKLSQCQFDKNKSNQDLPTFSSIFDQ